MKTVTLTPEELGLLRALARIGRVHHYDAVGLRLATAGLAAVDGDRLVITANGYAAASAADTRRTSLRRQRSQSGRGDGGHGRPGPT